MIEIKNEEFRHNFKPQPLRENFPQQPPILHRQSK